MIDSISESAGASPDLKKTRRVKQASNNTDRLPPHSPEAEQGVLGCIILSPKECTAQCIEKLKAGGKEFYDLRHQTIYETFIQLYDDADPIDIITVQTRLKAFNLLEQVGGISYLASLADMVPSAANLSYYLDIVLEKFVLRTMIQTCANVVGRVYDYEGEVDQLMDEVERDILRISESRVSTSTPPLNALVQEAITDIEASFNNQGTISGIATGFIDLDRMTSGLQAPDVFVIAARPSMGKTSMAMQIAENVAVNLKIPVGVFSLEMSGRALVKRMICCRARVNLRTVRDGFLSERDFPKLTSAAGAINGKPLYIDDSAGLSILALRAKARRMWQQYGVKLFVIDYLQLLNALGTKRRVESRQQEIADISCGIKSLAKELSVPIIVLSQLNRDLEKDKSRKPRLSDLRESGAIEQDADIVGMLYKPSGGKKDEDENDSTQFDEAIRVNLLIAKSRNGPTGEIELTFLKNFTRFESAARVSGEDYPNTADTGVQSELIGG